MANLTRILNNQIYSKTIIASQKIADGTITGSLFSSNVTVPGDFLITGNLFVLGSSQTTTVASTNTYVNDPLIVMNNGYSGTNTYDEGLVFNRGTALNQAFVWSEFNQEFRLIGTTETGTTYGNVAVSTYANLHIGNLNVAYAANVGAITAPSLNVSGNVLASTIMASYHTGSTATFGNIAAVTIGNVGTQFNGAAINLSGNVLASTVYAQLVTADDLTVGNVASGFIGNTGTAFTGASINLSGNVTATELNIGTVKATGLINTTGNVSASQLIAATLSTRSAYGNIHLTQFASIFAQGNNSENQSIVQATSTGLSDGVGMWAFTGLDSRVYSSRGIAFATGLTMRDQDTPTGGVIKVAITAAGDLWANATTPASNSTTGALIVAGGVGIGGNLYVGAGIQGTIIGNTTAASGWFTTLSAVNNLWANASIATTTQGTGAIVVPNGGISVAGAANIAGAITTAGAAQFNNTVTVGGITAITNTTQTTGASTGALQVAGGASFTQDVWIGGNLYVTNIQGVTANIITVQDPLLYLRPNVVTTYNYDIGFYSAFTGTGLGTINQYQHTSVFRDPLDNTWKFVSNLAEPSASYITLDGTTIYDPIKAGNLSLVTNIPSTSTSTGALIVTGGAGIGGNIFQGGAYLDSSSSNFIFAGTPTTVNAYNAATALTVGAASGSLTLRNPTIVSSATAITVFNTVATSINFGQVANITLGAVSGVTTVQGNIAVNSVTESTSSSTGAIKTSGGLGVAGNIVQGGTRLETSASNYIFASTPTTVDAFKAATDLEFGATTGTLTINNPTVVGTQTTQALYNTVTQTLNFARSANITLGHTDGTTTFQGNANVQSITASINSATGAVKVMGGVGIRGNLNIAGDNTGIAYSGRGALTVGLDVAGGVLYPENVAQFTSNANSFSRISIQNISTQQNATSEFVAITNNGSNGAGYIATGIVSVNFNSPAIAPLFKPSDGYTYAFGGNLILTATKDVLLSAGGNQSADIIISATGANIGIQNTTAATSATTGALTTVGGMGIAANLYVGKGATINSTNGVESFKVLSSFSSNVAIYANTAPTGGNAGPAGSFTETVIIGGGNLQVQPGAVLKVGGATSMIIPVGPSAARPSSQGANDVAGMLRFNSTTNVMEYYDGSQWTVAGSSFTVISDRQFSGNSVGSYGNVDGTNTVYTIQSNSTTASTLVSINGVIQFPVLAYSVSGTTLTFTEPPAPGDVIDVRVLTTTASVTQLASGSGLNQFIADETGSSIWSGTSTTFKRVLVDPVGNLNFLTGNEITYTQTPVNVPSAAAPVLVDTFTQTAYSTAKYIISTKKDATAFESMEALLITDQAGNAYVTTYAIVNNGTAIGTLSANVVSGNVRLYYTSTSLTNANVKVMSTYIV